MYFLSSNYISIVSTYLYYFIKCSDYLYKKVLNSQYKIPLKMQGRISDCISRFRETTWGVHCSNSRSIGWEQQVCFNIKGLPIWVSIIKVSFINQLNLVHHNHMLMKCMINGEPIQPVSIHHGKSILKMRRVPLQLVSPHQIFNKLLLPFNQLVWDLRLIFLKLKVMVWRYKHIFEHLFCFKRYWVYILSDNNFSHLYIHKQIMKIIAIIRTFSE